MVQKPKKTKVNAWAVSDPGSRNHNEDAFLILKSSRQHVLAVCDGMGGHAAGEVASGLAVETIKEFFTEVEKGDNPSRESDKVLEEAIQRANLAILRDAQANVSRDGMGSTCVVALIRGNKLYLGHVGDSRAYMVRGGGIRQLTKDHSFVQEMINVGMITPHEAHSNPQRNVILQSLGRNENIKIEVSKGIPLQAGDYVLLCSDGLTCVIDDQEIAAHVDLHNEPRAVCDELVRLTNRRGAPDNVTVALLRFEGEVQDGPMVALVGEAGESSELYRAMLKREGMRVQEFPLRQLETLTQTAAQERPRLIIVDHEDGAAELMLRACRAISTHQDTSGVPLLLVTDGSISAKQGQEAGAKRVLTHGSLLTDLSPALRLMMSDAAPLIYVLEEVPGRAEPAIKALRSAGFLVIGHSSQALLDAAIAQQAPKMLILDITRGVERLCMEYKNHPSTSGCPLVLSAEGAVANPREAFLIGADYYLTQPAKIAELSQKLLSKPS